MRVALVAGSGRSGLACILRADGAAEQAPQPVPDVPRFIADCETAGPVRWVWQSARSLYPRLLQSNVVVGRCHDVGLVEALLAARDGEPGQSDPAAVPGPAAAPGQPHNDNQPAQLPFEAAAAEPDLRGALDRLVATHAGQLERLGADPSPAKLALLAAAESAGGLAAAEMTAAGLPWRADVHDRLLTDLLGARPTAAPGSVLRPARLVELAARISAALGATRPVNPDSPPQLLRALAASGIRASSTRTSALRQLDHPVIPLLLEYKELARLHAANGWSWLDTWVSGERFRPEYVVGGVVSGRWASRGGGALQIPRLLRQAVIADPGWRLVVADAAQLEPRVLAALAGDRGFAEAAAGGDLYAAVADAVGGDRATAKVALLSAMYGGTGGDRGRSLALLRRRFPQAAAFVESAARAGEEGRVVRSVLGRTCPRPSLDWLALTSDSADPDQPRDPAASSAARARGRFTRNFVVQASAADWALVLLALLRYKLASLRRAGGEDVQQDGETVAWQRPHLVFFQHDEVIVHCPAAEAAGVAEMIAAAAAQATALVFGPTDVSFPMTTAIVDCYAQAK